MTNRVGYSDPVMEAGIPLLYSEWRTRQQARGNTRTPSSDLAADNFHHRRAAREGDLLLVAQRLD